MIKGCLGVIKPSDSKYDLYLKRTEKLNLEGLKSVFFKRCASKVWWGSVRSYFRKVDSFTLETSENHLIRNCLRNGRLRVNNNACWRLKKSLCFLRNWGLRKLGTFFWPQNGSQQKLILKFGQYSWHNYWVVDICLAFLRGRSKQGVITSVNISVRWSFVCLRNGGLEMRNWFPRIKKSEKRRRLIKRVT